MAFCYSCMTQLNSDVSVCPVCKGRIPYVPTREEDLKPGTKLNGRFIVGRALGHGGYGITYIAYDPTLQVRRTIKEYFPRGAYRGPDLSPVYPDSEAASVARTKAHFLEEARIMTLASEGHTPGIVQAFDKFDENGTTYILMEYLDGCTLDDYMHHVQCAPFKWNVAVHYVAEALDALQRLHDKNILHRDISCNNIFLCKDNSIRLIDLGSAEPLDWAQARPAELWKSRKPAYTPREQAEGRPQGPYSDVYAMGVVLFKMIAGNVDRNLNGQQLPSLRATTRNQEIPQALDRILAEATQEDPSKRIQTAAEFRKQLLPLIGEEDKGKRHTGLVVIIALAVVLAGLIMAVALGGNRNASEWNAIGWDSDQNAYSLKYGEVLELSGTAQQGETVRLMTQRGSEEAVVQDEIQTDADGNWSLVLDTRLVDVAENQKERFTGYVIYADETHPLSSSSLSITVDRELKALTLGYNGESGQSKTVSAMDWVYLSGTGETGQPVSITITGEDGTLNQDAQWSGDNWFCTLDAAKLAPGSGVLSKTWTIRASYTGFESETQTNKALSLTVRRSLQNISIAFQEDLSRATSLEQHLTLHGTAEPGENLTILVGQASTLETTTLSDGSWEVQLPAAGDLPYRPGEEVVLPVWARYTIDASNTSEELSLVLAIEGEAELIPPELNVSATQINEDEQVTLSGTAEPGANLNLSVQRTGDERNLTPGVTIQANVEDGTWEKILTPNEIVDQRQEGVTTQYIISVFQEKDDTTLSSVTARLYVYKPVNYDVPTIHFQDMEETRKTVSYAEVVSLNGTAKPGERLRLLADGTAVNANITTDENGDWNYTLSDLSAFMPELNAERKVLLSIRYVNTDLASAETLTLTVTNAQFAPLTLSLQDHQDTWTAGGNEDVALTVNGEAGKLVEILRNANLWQTGTLDGEGVLTLSINTQELPSGLPEFTFYTRYADQAETISNEVTLKLDREAEPISLQGTITEYTTIIRGLAEAGAVITLRIEGQEDRVVTAGENGTFVFDQLELSAGGSINISETDRYGNTADWTGRITEIPRDNITVTGYTNSEALTYGPGMPTLKLSGTATGGKALSITLDETGSGGMEALPDESGQWSAEVELPMIAGQHTLNIQYADGKGSSFVIYALCDNETAAPVIRPETIYQRQPETVMVTASEAGSEFHWYMESGDGQVLQESGAWRRIDGLQITAELPKERTAGNRIVFQLRDPYGNEAETVITIQEQRDEIKGVISSVLSGEDELRAGDSFSQNLRVEAYAGAGSDANATAPVLQLLQDNHIASRANLQQVTNKDDLARVRNKLSGSQMDYGWKIKNGELLLDYLQPGSCELRLVSGDTVLESWELEYVDAGETTGTAMHYSDDAAGYDIGVDAPTQTFNPRTIFVTGWLYKLYDDVEKSVNSAKLFVYSDAEMTNRIDTLHTTKSATHISRIPNTTQCDADYMSLSSEAIQDAGWIVSFQGNAKTLSTGTWWAQLDAGGEIFGPFTINIDANAATVKLDAFTESLSWGGETE